MFSKSEPPVKPGTFESLLGKSVEIKGTVKSRGSLRIEGAVEGAVETLGDVAVSAGAVLNASLKAQNATVAGTVTGNVSCSGRLELYPTAKVKGDITAMMFVVSEGALFQGHAQVQETKKVSSADPKADSQGQDKPK